MNSPTMSRSVGTARTSRAIVMTLAGVRIAPGPNRLRISGRSSSGLTGYETFDLSLEAWFWWAGFALVALTAAAWRFVRSDAGRLLQATRDNEMRCSYLGIDTARQDEAAGGVDVAHRHRDGVRREARVDAGRVRERQRGRAGPGVAVARLDVVLAGQDAHVRLRRTDHGGVARDDVDHHRIHDVVGGAVGVPDRGAHLEVVEVHRLAVGEELFGDRGLGGQLLDDGAQVVVHVLLLGVVRERR